MKLKVFIATVLATSLFLTCFAQNPKHDYNKGTGTEIPGKPVTTPLKVHVIYDNYVFKEGTKADWGFLC